MNTLVLPFSYARETRGGVLLSISTFILVLMSTMFFANSVAAQCPADSLPGPVSPMSPWLYICDTVMVPNNNGSPPDSCPVRVCYCVRTGGLSAPYTEIFINGYDIVDEDCNPFAPGENPIKILFVELVNQNPSNLEWPCPPCGNGGGAPNTRLTTSGCRTNTVPSQPCAGCCFYCVVDFRLCCDENGNKIITKISESWVGTQACPSGCTVGPCDPF
ncbi:MAG: hypothetical protein J0M05_06460 [Candidatus Kapabacteria bacterium]|nr:hypothetical protein [Candidatus Kapabacteria bacterium]